MSRIISIAENLINETSLEKELRAYDSSFSFSWLCAKGLEVLKNIKIVFRFLFLKRFGVEGGK